MTTLTEANRQWATRPDDQRFTSLDSLMDHVRHQRETSRGMVVPSRRIHLLPDQDNKGMTVVGPNGHAYSPTNYAFGQLAYLAEAPAGYMRTLPSPIAADCINYGLQFKRDIEDVGVLLQRDGTDILRAATGPRYGRIWNEDCLKPIMRLVGEHPEWKIPGEFRQEVEITKQNTTLYASDRDIWIFLADETNRIELPNRRDGKPGSLARGFFMWNSEVGASTYGLMTFFYDYVCCNRFVWGAEDISEIRIRHTASAPDKFLQEVTPALIRYTNSSASSITDAIEAARKARLGDDLDKFLAERFGARQVSSLKTVHQLEEGRPIETLWDVATAVTAQARSITHQDVRVDLERKAGAILKLAA